jgi:ribosome modulation factor
MSALYTKIGGGAKGKVPAHARKGRWFKHISSCYAKGYQAFLEGLSIVDCPYRASAYTKGVQQQRIHAWERGFKRASQGKPLSDING